MHVIISGRSTSTPGRPWRAIALLLTSICLSVAIGLAMLITALTPASVAAPAGPQSTPGHACTVGVVWPGHSITSATCPLTTLSSKCCTRPFLG